jgi:hypothetical protein
MDPFFARARARIAVEGHALANVWHHELSLDRQLQIAMAAEKMVGDVATATQNPAFLTGHPEEDRVATDAIYANALVMLLRYEKDRT